MVTVRLATMEDFEFFYELKCEESNIFWTGHGEKPQRENIYNFYKNAIANADKQEARKIIIVESDGVPVGHLYLIPDLENNCFDLAPAISEKYRGKGYAKMAYEQGLKLGREYGFAKMRGSVREDNTASIKLLVSCGAVLLPEYKMVYIPKLDKEVKMFDVEIKLD